MKMPAWPADKVERRPVAGLVPYARNARQHTDAQVAQIAASIREWGWTNPVLVDEDSGIIAGHGRVLAAHMLGIADVPVMVARGWSEAQRRAYVLADNKLALNASWDDDLLRVELADLQALGFGVELTGFAGDELAGLLAPRGEGLTDPDDAPELPADPVTVLGDAWLLGRHRLVCGDSTTAASVDKALAGVKPHLMVTDPPYGVEYDPGWRGKARNADGKLLSTGNDRAIGKVSNDDHSDWREAYALFPGDVVYIWHAAQKTHVVADSLLATAQGTGGVACQPVGAKVAQGVPQHLLTGPPARHAVQPDQGQPPAGGDGEARGR
jgi:ParB-like nuclease domain